MNVLLPMLKPRALLKNTLYQISKPTSPRFHQPFTTLSIRYSSSNNTPSSTPPPPPPPPTNRSTRQNVPEYIKKTIPGETEQSNSLLSRLPTFPLKNTSTLLPKPGVPMGSTHTLRSMLEILHGKKEPELIYEAESHKLYFLFCGAFALVFTLYGLVFTEFSLTTAYNIYKEDQDLLIFAGRLGLCALGAGVAASLVMGAMTIPTRLIRRIYYLPGKVEHIQFTTHPLLPGRATPIHTIPLEQFNRTKRGRIYTKNGIYGTLDKGSFFFLLKELDKKFGYWLVDRNGWFWGDGRIFDVIFGKESVIEAEKALKYDEKFGQATKKLKEEKTKLREKHGRGYQLKFGAEMLKDDIAKITQRMNKKADLEKINSNSNTKSKKSKLLNKKKKQS